MECPKCKSQDIAKRMVTRRINFPSWYVGSKRPYAYRVKEYQCVSCWHEFDVI